MGKVHAGSFCVSVIYQTLNVLPLFLSLVSESVSVEERLSEAVVHLEEFPELLAGVQDNTTAFPVVHNPSDNLESVLNVNLFLVL